MAALLGRLPGWLTDRSKSGVGQGRDVETPISEDSSEQTGSTTGGGTTQEPVVVWDASNHMEAQIIKGRLESEGIPTIIQGEAVGLIYGLTSVGLAETKVLVPAPLADKAVELLNHEIEWEEEHDA